MIAANVKSLRTHRPQSAIPCRRESGEDRPFRPLPPRRSPNMGNPVAAIRLLVRSQRSTNFQTYPGFALFPRTVRGAR